MYGKFINCGGFWVGLVSPILFPLIVWGFSFRSLLSTGSPRRFPFITSSGETQEAG